MSNCASRLIRFFLRERGMCGSEVGSCAFKVDSFFGV